MTDRTNDCVLCGRGGHRANNCPTRKLGPNQRIGPNGGVVQVDYSLADIGEPDEKAAREYFDAPAHPTEVLVRALPNAPVVELTDPEDYARVHIPVEELPRVVRELAALMTRRERNMLTQELMRGPEVRAVPSVSNESGPGISSLPEKREPAAFLDEDLLCEDA